MRMSKPEIAGIVSKLVSLVSVEDHEGGHYVIRVLGLRVFDTRRQEARIERRKARRAAKKAAS